MDHDDRTIRLPGDRGGDPGLPDRGFGYDPSADTDQTAQFETGYAAPYGDRTMTLPGGPVGHADPAKAPDRLLVHGVWEVMLLVMVGALGAYCFLSQNRMFSGSGRDALLMSGALVGFLALAFAMSLRAAVPNLAVGGIATLAGVLFVKVSPHAGTLGGLGAALGAALAAGFVLGLVVILFHVPGWAASLGALCGCVALTAWLSRGRELTLHGHPYAPGRQAVLWFALFAAVSILLGIIGLIGPVRRGLGSWRPVADPAARRGPGAALAVLVALTVSSGVAAVAGVLTALMLRSVQPMPSLQQTLLPIGAVLVGGVSAYGRRGGVLGTALGVAAVTLVTVLGQFQGWNPTVAGYATAGGALLLGMLVTRLIEWGGKPRDTLD